MRIVRKFFPNKNFFAALILSLVVLVFVSCELLPTTRLYRAAVTSLWWHNHPGVAYYLNRDDAPLAMQIGQYYFDGGAYDLGKAASSFERAISINPKIQQARYQLARIYFVEGDQPRALEYINAELALNPLNLRSLYVRGLIELAQNNLPGAELDFSHFVAWAPTEWGGYNDLAFTFAKEGKYVDSEATIKAALTKVPNAQSNPWLFNSLGLAQLNEHKYTNAEASFLKALELAQSLTGAQWQRAYSADDPNVAAQSITTFQQSIQNNLSTAKTGATIE